MIYRSINDTMNKFCNALASIISAIIVLSFVSTASAESLEGKIIIKGNTLRGEQLSQTCLGCHGAPGLRNPGPVYDIPMIGGQHPEYIISALQAYKNKDRSHGTMQAQASNLSDQDMRDIGAFFGAMKGNSQPSEVNTSKAELGQEISMRVCTSCHTANGDSDNAQFPKLAGQYESYLKQALKDYRSKSRKNAVMAVYASELTIQEIEALSAWFASQPGGLSAPLSEIFK